jgi:methionine-rich copper-binding protein CopC
VPRLLRAALLGALALPLLVVLAGPASAHTALVSTSPADGAQAAVPPAAVVLVFDQPVSTRLSTVQVTGPEGGTWQAGPAGVLGGTVTQPLVELGPAGTYRVAWRVVAPDGHPVTGTSSFTLGTAGTGTPVEASVASAGRGGGLPVGVLAAAGVPLVAATAVYGRRRRAAEVPGQPAQT